MAVAYWIIAALLALLYLFSGGVKIVRSKAKLRPMMGWVDTWPLGLIRTVGVVEVLGALGLVLPPLTGIAPVVALVAALGLFAVQIGAIILHTRRGETRQLGLNVVLAGLAGLAAWFATVWA